MDPRFLEHYETELQHLREVAAEFATEHRKVASRLDLSADPSHLSRDPYVKMLLEGAAYLAARVHHKLDAEFPRFTQSLLDVIFPQFLSPTPSMAIIGFEPDYDDPGLAAGFVLSRGAAFRGHLAKGERTASVFCTAHEITLWPVKLDAAAYYGNRSLHQAGLPSQVSAKAAFCFRLRCTAGLTFNQIGAKAPGEGKPFDHLVFHIRDDGQGFLRGPGRDAGLIYEQLFSRTSAIVVSHGQRPNRQQVVLPAACLRRLGFEDEESLLPPSSRTFMGYRLLKEYFSFPDRFLFFEIRGLEQAARQCVADTIEVAIVLKEEEARLEGCEPGQKDQPLVNEGKFALYAAPAINLFPMELDRVSLSDRFSEFHVIADKTALLDYEIYSLDRVTGYGSLPEERQEFRPFYSARDNDEKATGFYVLYRSPRTLTEQEKQFGQAPSYLGCEVYLSLVDAQAAPFNPKLKQLGFEGLCTNRHLPARMAKGIADTDLFALDLAGPFSSTIRFLSGPTEPVASPAFGSTAWRLISHLSLNYLSLADVNEREGAAALRNALTLYLDEQRTKLKQQIGGLLSVRAQPVTRRVPSIGPITFARGLELTVQFDEDAFAGSSLFILGSVLEQFFARYVSLNSFTETLITSRQRREIVRWPPRIGTRNQV